MSNFETDRTYVEVLVGLQKESFCMTDFENEIREYFLPELDKCYAYIKPFLKQKTKQYFYNIRKYIIGLLPGEDEIPLNRLEKTESSFQNDVYIASFETLSYLNTLYFSLIKIKNTSVIDFNDLTYISKINRMLKEIQVLEAILLTEIENRKQDSGN